MHLTNNKAEFTALKEELIFSYKFGFLKNVSLKHSKTRINNLVRLSRLGGTALYLTAL